MTEQLAIDLERTLGVSQPATFVDEDAAVEFPHVPSSNAQESSSNDANDDSNDKDDTHDNDGAGERERRPSHPGRLRRPSKSDAPDLKPPADSDIIPTAIVIKNIPFAMKRDQLIAIIDDLKLPQPYALNYHFENGAFRGLAFANFRSGQEADLVVRGLEGYEALGRRIKVEYKKVLPPEEAARKEAERRASVMALEDRVPEFDLSDPATRALYEKMVHFRDDKSRYELIFAKTITGPERKLVRAIGQRLGFFYRTEDNGEERFFKVARKTTPISIKDKVPRKYSMTATGRPMMMAPGLGAPTLAPPGPVPALSSTLGTGIPAGLAIPDHRVPAAVASLRAAEGRIRAYTMGAQDGGQNGLNAGAVRSPFRKNSILSQAPPPGFNAMRQPKGPEHAPGFTSAQAGRKLSLNPGALPFNVNEVQAAVEMANQRKHAVEIVNPASKAISEEHDQSDAMVLNASTVIANAKATNA